MEEQSTTFSKSLESGSIDQAVSTSSLVLTSSVLPNTDDITSTPIPSNTTLHFYKGDSKIEITHENNSPNLTSPIKEIRTFYSVFMRSFQIFAVGMILLMIGCAGLGVWWGSTSAFAGILHTPLGGTIGLKFEIVCVVAATAASFWTGVTGGPVVWDKASYVGKKLDIRRIGMCCKKSALD